MKRKTIWCVISGVMVLSLVLAACAPAVVEKEDEDITTPTDKEDGVDEDVQEEEVVEEKEMVENVWGTLVEKPQYGGTLTYGTYTGPDAFGYQVPGVVTGEKHFINDAMMAGDYAKGPSGSNEESWMYYLFPKRELLRGEVLESWELVDENTLRYTIRKGIYFHDKPPVNGRQLDAYDVEASIRYMWHPGIYHSINYPESRVFDRPLEDAIYAEDQWHVIIVGKPGWIGQLFEKTAVYYVRIHAKELLADDTWNWTTVEGAIGTGPFLLQDHIGDSSTTYIRNTNYWQDNPLFPGMKMPFVDRVKHLVIPDASTRQAALRSGKIDQLGDPTASRAISWEDAASLWKSNPELKYVGFTTGDYDIGMRLDKTDLPFADINVRKALNMAINAEEMIDTLYGGEGERLTYPTAPIQGLATMYMDLDEYPADVAEIYTYNPEKAIELLTEAGYPDGFKTSIVCHAPQIDGLLVVQQYWAKIGVDLTLDVKEYAVYASLGISKKTFPEMFAAGIAGYSPWWWGPTSPGGSYNFSLVNDAKVQAKREEIEASYWDEEQKFQLYKDFQPYLLSQAWYVLLPDPKAFTFWQPWLKNYNGELTVGYYDNGNWPKWIWIDQDLKYELVGVR